MTVFWSEASQEVLSMAKELIKQYHPRKTANIGYAFRSEAQMSGGHEVWAKAQKITDKFRLTFMELDFFIWIALDKWDQLTDHQRQALIDHELSHCTMSDDGVFKIRGHDLEEFNHIIDRWGFWDPRLQRAKPAIENALQMDLPGLEKKQGKVVGINPGRLHVEVEELTVAG